LYDSYIRAIRWASDRVGTSGVMGFVTNAGFIEANTGDGLRKCLVDEFSSIYVFHLRGNQRTSGELSRKEGGKIFGSGSRAPIAITIFVKNPNATEHGKIYFHDIGDYLSQTQKLEKITQLHSINGITAGNAWRIIKPDTHNDWINQRDYGFSTFPALARGQNNIFSDVSIGVSTSRDAWVINYSRILLLKNINYMIDNFNHCIKAMSIDYSPNKISWSSGLLTRLKRQEEISFNSNRVYKLLYRPFTIQWFYADPKVNERLGKLSEMFPTPKAENLIIHVIGKGETVNFSTIMSKHSVNFHTMSTGQAFPLYLYEANNKQRECLKTETA